MLLLLQHKAVAAVVGVIGVIFHVDVVVVFGVVVVVFGVVGEVISQHRVERLL